MSFCVLAGRVRLLPPLIAGLLERGAGPVDLRVCVGEVVSA
jgi:hypothetical protein